MRIEVAQQARRPIPAMSPGLGLGVAGIMEPPARRSPIEPAADDPAAIFVEDHRQHSSKVPVIPTPWKPRLSMNCLASKPEARKSAAWGWAAEVDTVSARITRPPMDGHPPRSTATDLRQPR